MTWNAAFTESIDGSYMRASPAGPRGRIAIVAASLEILGGHGVQAWELARGLQDDGYEVDWLPINPAFPPELRWARRYPYVRTIFNQAMYLPSLHRLRYADVVHIFSASYWSFLLAPAPALLAARSFKKRSVLNYHSGEAENHLAHWGRRVHPWLKLADEIVVPSEYLRDVFGRHGYEARVIPNIVDLERFRYRERNPVRPRFLSTRNLEPYYRIENTVKAFSLIKSEIPEAALTIAGYGSEEPSIRQLAAMLGTDGIRFVGRIEPSMMPYVYDESDIFLNSSVVDNQPISVLEAFAAGLPVISTPAGDIGSMVQDGRTGILVPAEDPDAMAAAAATLLRQPDHALSIARRARAMVETRTWTAVRDQWLEAYRIRERAESPTVVNGEMANG